MDIKELNKCIDEIDKISDSNWIKNLEDRKLKELEFHNKDRDQANVEEVLANDTYEKFYGNKKYYNATTRSSKYVEYWIKVNCKNKVFLDYACGNGGNAIKASMFGAKLALGLDISEVSVLNAKNVAKNERLTNVRFFQADAENTKLPDNSIDVIICSGMLHHLDLSFALPELRRIMKPGGKILAIEALDYNPFIKLYRMLTPEMRTDWEKAHILSFKDINFASRFFKVKNIKYWHVVGYIGGKFPILIPLLDGLDKILEKVFLIQRLSWIFTFELIKE
jgi:ubiquinone/menaquinone biosynthesis C-methylase UbiE